MEIQIDKTVTLQNLKASDAGDIFRTIDRQREYLGKWLPFVETTKRLEDSEGFVASVVNADERNFEHVFSIRKNGEFIGLIGFKDTDRQSKKTEIGYWLSKDQQGQGIMTRAAQRLCEIAFSELGMNRVQIKCAVGNKASKKIPKRLGFLLEGIERDGELLSGGEYTDLEVYSLLKQDV
ncbi:GNAT family N-acetyltransferase [Marispirochaeta sp.]|uniref:GNAT family N-acetyltransferase n=1 Tax=Marispirochaeta sp. TaxID=2038653 RepID=UPI0029C85540|nr:GNAT family N-acetyltransferase [Marispirochaeta sp.]